MLEKRGKTHLTKAEKERRKAEELAIPGDLGEISAPKYIKQFENLDQRDGEAECASGDCPR